MLNDVTVFKPSDGILVAEKLKVKKIVSLYDYEKINSLFKNFDTMSFLDITLNYNNLLNSGYNKMFLNQSLHTLLSLPFFFVVDDCFSVNINVKYFKKI